MRFLCWMQCVMTVHFQVLINREPLISLQPSRGLRQGDPLSFYLFILCPERFSSLISRIVEQGDWKGIKIGIEAPFSPIYSL